MLPSVWQNVQRLLVIQPGNVEELVLQTLRQSLPSTAITLMTSPSNSQLALHLPYVDNVLVYEAAGFTSLNAETELALIELLSRSAFDAAVILTNAQSPYSLAYICYLAGIPIRLGQSQEFGGSVLSEWVKSGTDIQGQSHLFLLESAGFSLAHHL